MTPSVPGVGVASLSRLEWPWALGLCHILFLPREGSLRVPVATPASALLGYVPQPTPWLPMCIFRACEAPTQGGAPSPRGCQLWAGWDARSFCSVSPLLGRAPLRSSPGLWLGLGPCWRLEAV